MLKVMRLFFSLKTLKFLLRLLASLASAILVVSGYLFFVSTIDRGREMDQTAADAKNGKQRHTHDQEGR